MEGNKPMRFGSAQNKRPLDSTCSPVKPRKIDHRLSGFCRFVPFLQQMTVCHVAHDTLLVFEPAGNGMNSKSASPLTSSKSNAELTGLVSLHRLLPKIKMQAVRKGQRRSGDSIAIHGTIMDGYNRSIPFDWCILG